MHSFMFRLLYYIFIIFSMTRVSQKDYDYSFILLNCTCTVLLYMPLTNKVSSFFFFYLAHTMDSFVCQSRAETDQEASEGGGSETEGGGCDDVE